MSYLSLMSEGDSPDETDESSGIIVVERERRLILHPTYEAPFHIARLKPMCFVDETTRKWIRTAADERAAQEGMFFSTESADYAIDWTEKNCIVYEGSLADTPFYLDDWAYELYCQLFGWMMFDEEWNECIRRYRRVSGWVPKKNGKSPTLASIGTYLWAGDGEAGQKCYSVAKDGGMARIAHMHAVQFVRKNPALAALCKIDNSTLEMTYKPTNSSYKILFSGSSSQSSNQEGLNGSTVVDETHVVSPDLIKVIERAGISRKEPVHIELSTTGYNIEGYGHTQYKRGIRNLQKAELGEVYNPRLLFFNYGIPQDTGLEDIRDPVKIREFIKIANPSLGRLIKTGEIMADWAESCATDTQLYEFAMYRLNLWHRSGQGAIAMADWLKCRKKYTMEELKDYPSVVGLDLSKNRDMTAVVLMFSVPVNVNELPNSFIDGKAVIGPPDGEEDEEVIGLDVDVYEAITTINIPYLFPFFFLPEATIPLYAEHIDLRKLGENNNLILVPGLTIRPEVVAQFIHNLVEDLEDFRVIAGDPWRFKAVKKILITNYGWTEESMVNIKQTWENMAPAYEALERLTLSQELAHPDNEILNWQLGNIVLVEDHSGNRRISKPKHGDYKKIDGVAAVLNGLTYMCNDEEMVPGSDGLFNVLGDEEGED